MMITAGPISLTRPGWGLRAGTVTSLVTGGEGGRPEVLAAQMICNAAISGVRVLMLLPYQRGDDDVWEAMISLLADGDQVSAIRTLSRLPLTMHTCGRGQENVGHAQLVYAPNLSGRQVRQFDAQTNPATLVVNQDFGGKSPLHGHNEVVRVGADVLVVGEEGFEVPVVYDPSGPMYRHDVQRHVPSHART